MSSSIYILELPNLTIENVKVFCEQGIPEGVRIEYKKEFPKAIERTICAFSNTAGGIILIGVEAEKRTNKPTDIPGIKLTEGLEERVINICLSHIMPPVIPEVKVCDFKSSTNAKRSDRAVLFVRVRPDYAAPHYLLDKNEVLVRAHNRNTRADLRTIESLIGRREEIKASQAPVSAFCQGKEIPLLSCGYSGVDH